MNAIVIGEQYVQGAEVFHGFILPLIAPLLAYLSA